MADPKKLQRTSEDGLEAVLQKELSGFLTVMSDIANRSDRPDEVVKTAEKAINDIFGVNVTLRRVDPPDQKQPKP
jgi:hypothetical protein